MLRHERVETKDTLSRSIVLDARQKDPEHLFDRQLSFAREVFKSSIARSEELTVGNRKIELDQRVSNFGELLAQVVENAPKVLKRELMPPAKLIKDEDLDHVVERQNAAVSRVVGSRRSQHGAEVLLAGNPGAKPREGDVEANRYFASRVGRNLARIEASVNVDCLPCSRNDDLPLIDKRTLAPHNPRKQASHLPGVPTPYRSSQFVRVW